MLYKIGWDGATGQAIYKQQKNFFHWGYNIEFRNENLHQKFIQSIDNKDHPSLDTLLKKIEIPIFSDYVFSLK